ncbi:Cytochrome c oxidase subunit 4 [Jannaschia seosinensis]|uniref:Cytochrome c oxidase subunit 4 n=1 Tax=Jannaschia seosinensis TaxID=313367 RepID=A0A0M7BDS6_9RHOB|nr:aa3-type cytochrome c oxidase subunit IV [Jannaschia seosinensis]CUH40339.1 Cytochrome c oxidase subunit 4 [Jannaschia seosinensis]
MDEKEKHEMGTMDITEQEKTFAGFMTFTKWVTIVIIAILIFLALFRT